MTEEATQQTRSIIARWQGLSSTEREHLVLREQTDGIVAESVFLSGGGAEAFAVHYKLFCDLSWNALHLDVAVIGSDKRLIIQRRIETGQWFTEAGEELAHLQGLIDIDLSISPFTNTLPIRRLNLAKGQSADITVVYVILPEVTVHSDPQRYTRLDTNRYHFDSVDSDFHSEIEVDNDGLVTHYPGLFARIS